MSYGPYRVYTASMASGGTLTGEVNVGRVFENIYLMIPTMTSNTQLYIQASDVTGGTYRRIWQPVINSSTVGTNLFAVPSAVTNGMIPLPNGFQYMKVESTATVDGGVTFQIFCASP